MPAPLDPITHKSKADTVATRLRQMIASGRYQPGEKLIQGELAAVLGVSTMPVREALLRLSADGLVTSESNRRFAVASNTAEELRDTFWMYSLIQSELARRACLRADQRSLVKALTEIHTSYRDGIDDPEARSSANWEFFKAINVAARSITRGSGRIHGEDRYENHYCWLFHLRDGVIVEIHEFMDTLYANQMLNTAGWIGRREPKRSEAGRP